MSVKLTTQHNATTHMSDTANPFRIYLFIEDDDAAIHELLNIAKSEEGWQHLVHEYKYSIVAPFELDEYFPTQTMLPSQFTFGENQIDRHPYFIITSPDQASAIFCQWT